MTEGILHLDLRGMLCPVPVRETRLALRGLDEGARLDVSADDPDALRDIPTLVERSGLTLLGIEEHAGEYRFRILKAPPTPDEPMMGP